MTEQEFLASDDPAVMLEFCRNPAHAGIAGQPYVSERQLRLFACACCRQVWDLLTDDAPCPRCRGEGTIRISSFTDACPECFDMRMFKGGTPCGTGRINRSRRAVEVAERYADGEMDLKYDITEAQNAIDCAFVESNQSPVVLMASWPLRAASDGARRMIKSDIVPPTIQAALLREIVGNPFRPVTLPGGVGVQHPIWGLGIHYPWLLWNDRAVLKLAQAIYDTRDFGSLPVLADALEEAGCDHEELLRHLRGEEQAPVTKQVPVKNHCPECGGPGRWRSGVGFEHEKICMSSKHKSKSVVWEPGAVENVTELEWRPLRSPHVRGCWALDIIIGKS